MKRLKLLSGAFLLMAMLFAGCQKQTHSIKEETTAGERSAVKSSSRVAALKEGIEERLNRLKAGQENRTITGTRFLLRQHPEYRNLLLNALNDVPACNDDTKINLWLNDQLSDWTATVVFYAIETGMLDYPTYDALIFENSGAGQVFGAQGTYTQRLTKTFKDLKRFWDIESAGIVMVAMHGDMLLDREKIIRTDMALYGTTEEDAGAWADLIIEIINAFPQYRMGNHPIFTFNAFAQKGFDTGTPYEPIPDKIVMGDGILDGFNAIGYGDVAPQTILAHEFGHQVQYQLNLTGGSGPEASRRSELMADAFSAYFLAHSRGQSMNWKRVQQFLQVFFNTGDCSFTSNDHHGTPAQRMAAATWAYGVVEAAQKQGHILSAAAFASMFDAVLPQILNN